MEPNVITIGGDQVALSWTQETARRFAFRSSKIGGGPTFAEFRNPKKAAAAVTTFLWLILPPAIFSKYPQPEDLFVVITDEDAPSVHAAIMSVISQMTTGDEEKKTSLKTHSQGSNSD